MLQLQWRHLKHYMLRLSVKEVFTCILNHQNVLNKVLEASLHRRGWSIIPDWGHLGRRVPGRVQLDQLGRIGPTTGSSFSQSAYPCVGPWNAHHCRGRWTCSEHPTWWHHLFPASSPFENPMQLGSIHRTLQGGYPNWNTNVVPMLLWNRFVSHYSERIFVNTRLDGTMSTTSTGWLSLSFIPSSSCVMTCFVALIPRCWTLIVFEIVLHETC